MNKIVSTNAVVARAMNAALKAANSKPICNNKKLPLETEMKEEFKLIIRYKQETEKFIHTTSYVIDKLMKAYERVKAEDDQEAAAWAQKFAYKAHDLLEAVKKNKI